MVRNVKREKGTEEKMKRLGESMNWADSTFGGPEQIIPRDFSQKVSSSKSVV